VSKPTFEELRRQVRLQLQDAEGNYWTDDEIDKYFDEGQLEYVRKTKALRSEGSIYRKINNDTYALPDDCLEVIRIEDKNGDEIPRSSSDQISIGSGSFRNRSSNSSTTLPSFAYSDLDGLGGIRFSPRPNPSIEETSVVFQRTEYPYRLFGSGELEPTAGTVSDRALYKFDNDDYIYGVEWTGTLPGPVIILPGEDYRVYRYVLDDDGATLKEDDVWAVDLVITGGSNVSMTKLPQSPDRYYSWSNRFFFAETDLAAPGTIYYFDGWKQAWNVFGNSAHGIPRELLARASSKQEYALLYYHTSDGKVIRTPADTFSETVLATGITSLYQWAVTSAAYEEKVYFAAGSGGLYEIDGLTVTQISTDRIYSCCVSDGVLYALVTNVGEDGKLMKLSGGSLVLEAEDASILENASSTGIYSDQGRIFIPRVALADVGCAVYDTRTKEFEGTAFERGLTHLVVGTPWQGEGFALKDRLYKMQSDYIYYTTRDEGAVGVIDDFFGADAYGGVNDIQSNDNDEIYAFSQEEGVISRVTVSSTGVHVFYVRKPQEGAVEISEPLALVHYALYKCYEKDSDQTSAAKSADHMAKFLKVAKRDSIRVANGFIGKQQPTRGYHF
jgi:hypothetical protein